MTRDQAVTLIKQRLGNRQDLDTSIVTEMDLTQETMLEQNGRITPWFLEKTKTDLVTVASQGYVTLPTDFLLEVEEAEIPITDTDSALTLLEKREFHYLVTLTDEGLPVYYSISGSDDKMHLRPIPDRIYTINPFRYYAKDTLPGALSGGGTNLWLTHAADVMIAEVGLVMANGYTKDADAATMFQGDATKAWDRLNIMNEVRKHQNYSYNMGEPR